MTYDLMPHLQPHRRGPMLETTNAYMGSLMSFLARGAETGGRFAVMEYQAHPGNEPPPHAHEWEHELCYVIEGAMELYCDGQVLVAGPGEVVFMPQGVPHAFYIRSPRLRMLILVQATGEHPVGLDDYFRAMSAPADSMELPVGGVTYQMEDPQHAVRIGAAHGIRTLSPEEAAHELPHYPGFGVARPMLAVNSPLAA